MTPRRRRTPRAVLAPGQIIRELRKRKGWTQTVLAQHAGVAVATISRIECERSRVHRDMIAALSEALGLNVASMLRSDLLPDGKIDYSDILASTDEELKGARRVGRASTKRRIRRPTTKT